MKKILFMFLCLASPLLLSAHIAFADDWQGKATIQNPALGMPGVQVPISVKFDDMDMYVELEGVLKKHVDFRVTAVREDVDTNWAYACVEQEDGRFEIHSWAGYEGSDEYLNYSYVANQEDCDGGSGSDFSAMWLTRK